jgi:hypothetical protein
LLVDVLRKATAKSDRTFDIFFNTSCFARPPLGNLGSGTIASRFAFRGLGQNNCDVTFFKNWRFKEKATFQSRWEIYNAFNHPQFSGVNTGLQFNASGAEVNLAIGRLNSDRSPRIEQGSARITF